MTMAMELLPVYLPGPMKRRLMDLRKKGMTASAYIRLLIEKDFAKKKGDREAA